MNLETEILITGHLAKSSVPKTGTLEERIVATMRAVRNDDQINWMCRTDDHKFRAAVFAVMLMSSDGDQDRIARSLTPLKALSAAMNGVPVDFTGLLVEDDMIPLLSLWHQSTEPK